MASSVGVKPKKLLIHTVLDYTVHYMYVSRQSGQHLRKEVTAETSTLLPKVTLIVEFTFLIKLKFARFPGSWVHLSGPVIQANGRLTFEDDLRSGGLLCFISMSASVRTELADSMVTPGEPGGD